MSLRLNRARLLVLTSTLALLSGCGDDGIGKTHPVSGKVLLDGQPIKVTSGYVIFKPDAQKGNSTPFEPTGQIEPDGNYVLYTKTRTGAPPGWYKVVVTASGEPARPDRRGTVRPVAKNLVPPRYGQEKTTPLSIEVVASPNSGAYDLNVKTKD